MPPVRPLTPGRFLKLTDAELLRIGFSRQKTLYNPSARRISGAPLFRSARSARPADETARKMLVASKASVNGPPTSIY